MEKRSSGTQKNPTAADNQIDQFQQARCLRTIQLVKEEVTKDYIQLPFFLKFPVIGYVSKCVQMLEGLLARDWQYVCIIMRMM